MLDKSLAKISSVIFDLDGTLANASARRIFLEKSPKNWEAFFAGIEYDPPNIPVLNLYRLISGTKRHQMILVSGRPEKCRDASLIWLSKYNIPFDMFFMRANNDHRPDHLVKENILYEIQKLGYSVEFAVDDRNSVVKMWRKNGITCFQCDDGNF